MAETAVPKKAPPRHKIEAFPLTREHPDVRNKKAGFHYERFSKNPVNPGFAGKKLIPHAIGDDGVGWIEAPAWETVRADNDPDLVKVNERDDVGLPIDTVVQSGLSVLCRIPQDVYDKTYGRIAGLRDEQADQLEAKRAAGEAENFAAKSRTFSRVVNGTDTPVGELLEGVQ